MDLSKFIASLDQKAVYVYGLGKSGLVTAQVLHAAGAKVIAWDGKEEQRNALCHPDQSVQRGAEGSQNNSGRSLGCARDDITLEDYEDVDFSQIGAVILSPGIPLTHPAPHPVVVKAQAHHVEVLGDIEVLGRCLPDHIKTVGITGTNGKSTTTALLGHVLAECGKGVLVGGNFGVPVLSLDIPPQGEGAPSVEVIVLELSSYQIDLCPSFRPDIGVLLNITPDHIDRHGSLAQYAAVKAHIFGHLTRPIISTDDALCREIFDAEVAQGKAPIALSQNEKMPFDMSGIKTLAGAHNYQNASAVWHVCTQLGLKDAEIFAAMKTFPGLAHRQQIVRQVEGVTFINDSKATNAEAAAKALGTYENIYWIVGGQAKDGGLGGLQEFMPRVRGAYVIGAAATEFAAWLEKKSVAFEVNGTLEKAVVQAYEDAKKEGGVVLLSPACASWDQFKSFEHRGEVFAEVVRAL